ncbi:hypothetical protein C486_08935 [Natrinema gari JCM 14663]|uniref:Uncharacterized protein n=1 Tax=Natrinema gari JCM 14663 TaxID=1230459 RepID=L9Z146_9EURY|nr:hypothetical protein C486_08935 [Natrinema gari JCM 14663]
MLLAVLTAVHPLLTALRSPLTAFASLHAALLPTASVFLPSVCVREAALFPSLTPLAALFALPLLLSGFAAIEQPVKPAAVAALSTPVGLAAVFSPPIAGSGLGLVRSLAPFVRPSVAVVSVVHDVAVWIVDSGRSSIPDAARSTRWPLVVVVLRADLSRTGG